MTTEQGVLSFPTSETRIRQEAIRARCAHPSGAFEEFTKAEVEQSVAARFEQRVGRTPERLAVKTRQHELTYDALNRAANRVADALLDRRGQLPEPVALLFENGAPFVIASLGVLKTGKIQVPLDRTFPRARLAYTLAQSEATAIVSDGRNGALARELAGSRCLLIDIDELDGRSPSNPGLPLSPDAYAAINYTSGSTGEPKGIIQSHRGMLHAVMRHANTFRLSVDDRFIFLQVSTMAHLYPLLTGAAFYPVDLNDDDLGGVAGWLAQQEITVYRSAVSAFRGLAGTLTGQERFPHLRLITLFGEPTYYREVELYRKHFPDQCILASTLGCRECGDYAYFFVDKTTPLPSGTVPGGYPAEGPEVLLLDDGGRPVGVDEVGELAVRSRYSAIGYWRRPDLTQAAFLPDPAGSDERVYRTGDLGRRLPDGCLVHLGRRDFQVKIRGHRVDVAEVEAALLELDTIGRAVVVGREDALGERRLVAYLVPRGPSVPSVSALRRVLAAKLPEYMVPSAYVTLDTLPMTATGKLDRRALPAPERARPCLDAEAEPPRTPLERALAGIWSEVLGVPQVGIHDSFFDLGGHSLLATQLVSRLRDAFDVELPLRRLFERPTVAGLAAGLIHDSAEHARLERRALLLLRVARLSDAEAEAMLAEQESSPQARAVP